MPPLDRQLPGASRLFGAESVRLLARFLDARSWELSDARAVQAVYQPGRACVVRYLVEGMNPRGDRRILSLCSEVRLKPSSDLALPPADFEARHELRDPVEQMGRHLVWAFPYDPELASLPDAAWRPAVGEAVGAVARLPHTVSIEPLRYRPRRRAVFRYTALGGGETSVSYGKVIRPTRARRMADVASALTPRRRVLRRSSGPRLALPLGPEQGGLFLYPALAGRSLSELLLAGASLPAPRRITGLLDEFAAAGTRLGSDPDRHRRDPAHLSAHARALVVDLAPDALPGADVVTEAVARGLGETAGAPSQVVHGDLYDAQVLVDDEFGLGLIDLDDAGLGDALMDVANFSAHLVALALAVPQRAGQVMAYRRLARKAFLERLEASETSLAWREALAMLLLATAPFRVLMPRWPEEVARRVEAATLLASGSLP